MIREWYDDDGLRLYTWVCILYLQMMRMKLAMM